MSTVNNTILSVLRRTVNGFTVGEIYDRVVTTRLNKGEDVPPYNSVRARVCELTQRGELVAKEIRMDSVSGFTATAFVRLRNS